MGHILRQMRWQIAAAYTLLLLLALGGLSAALYAVTRTAYQRTLEAGVVGQARLVAALTEAVAPQDASRRLDPFVDDLGRQLRARVTLIGADGHILADSLLPPGRYTDQRDRPEVLAALRGGQGEMARYSTATGDDRFYVAVPFAHGASRGVARVGVPLATIATAQAQIGLAVGLAALLAALLAVALAVLIARRTTQPLRELDAMASRLAAGDLDVRVPVPDDVEVANLARSFNQMASQLRRQIDARAREGERLAAILATMDDGILILDADDQMALANRASRAALGFHARLPAVMSQVAGGEAIVAAARALRAQPERGPLTIDEVTPPTTRRSLRAIVTRLGGQAAPQTLVVLQDLTELRRAERARRTLLTNITHDFRTPLASLQALLDALDGGAIDEPAVARDFLARMTTEVSGLSRLVDEFLELSRIEQGAITLERTPAAPRALLEAAAKRMQAQASQKGIRLSLQPVEPLPLVCVDVNRIEQVLLNLLQNALVATPPGGQITLGARPTGDAVELIVRDTGRGISPADLPHIFERFYKADAARSGGGAGLGLAIARHLVERHGGRIAAASMPGFGSTFSLTLPAAATCA